MATIQDLREEYEAGAYWIGEDNELIRLEDIPTDGPLFEIVDEDDEYFKQFQVSVDEFEEGDFTRLELGKSDVGIVAKFESSGVEHEFEFGREFTPYEWDGPAIIWPERLTQQGEGYRVTLDDVPEFVIRALEEEYGVEVVER